MKGLNVSLPFPSGRVSPHFLDAASAVFSSAADAIKEIIPDRWLS